mmetsp:Transcript_34195/g.68084  ORF Transcript_34195/g.68084 Transcript_34195/m.68084 type:complete len:182 (-) Transcript_34195:121-666(-)
MADQFDVEYSVDVPFEGSIKITKQGGVPFLTSTWISKKEAAKPKHRGVFPGTYTELRFDNGYTNDGELLVCLYNILTRRLSHCLTARRDASARRERFPFPDLELSDKQNDVIEKIVAVFPDGFYYYDEQFTQDDMRRILDLPMPLELRASFPTYTWPRWLFGAFEGLVMRRVQLNHSNNNN